MRKCCRFNGPASLNNTSNMFDIHFPHLLFTVCAITPPTPSIISNIVKCVHHSLIRASNKTSKMKKELSSRCMTQKYVPAIYQISRFITLFQSPLSCYPKPIDVKNPFGVAFGGCLMVKQRVSWDINCQVLRFGIKKKLKDTAI